LAGNRTKQNLNCRIAKSHSNLFSKKIFDYKISNIVAVKVEDSSDIESTTYRLTLFLESGEKVPFTYSFTSGWKEKEQIADRLQNFLGIVRSRS
jgi:hypothetical protein